MRYLPVAAIGFLSHRTLERFIFLLGMLSMLTLLLLVFAAQPVLADGFVIPQPPVDRPIPWRDMLFTIKYHRVNVTIEDQVATTKVDQVFVNDASFAVEGTYIFPLPEDAAVSSFDMWVDGKKLEGKLLGRDEARRHLRRHRAPAEGSRIAGICRPRRVSGEHLPDPAHAGSAGSSSRTRRCWQANGLVHYRYPLNTEKFSARRCRRWRSPSS